MPIDAALESVGAPGAEKVGATGITAISPSLSAASQRAVERLHQSSAGRIDTPLRKRFVRAPDSAQPGSAPLASFFRRGGRGAAVDLKTYLAALWRCSAAPYNTELSARQYAALLDLPAPTTTGARRITDALGRLEERGLITVERRRGQPSIVGLLDESGNGTPYTTPSGKIAKGSKTSADHPHLYAKVPYALWSSGHMQGMSAPALAMLLILIEEQATTTRPAWFSTENFPHRYGISASVRARGTKELVARRLLLVTKQLVEGDNQTFGRERVRNRYALINEASNSSPFA